MLRVINAIKKINELVIVTYAYSPSYLGDLIKEVSKQVGEEKKRRNVSGFEVKYCFR